MKHKQIVILTILLSFISLAGNAAKLPLFYGIDLIFGSIAVMYAVLTLNRFSVLVVVLIGSSYTYYLWGHPYAAFIFTLEAIWCATFWNKGRKNIVLVDAGYWLVLGIPLVFLFYIKFIGLSTEASGLIALKQTLNGIFNALIASSLFFAMHIFWKKKERIRIKPLLFNIILTITLLSGAIPAIISTNQTSKSHERQVDQELNAIAQTIAKQISRSNPNNLSNSESDAVFFSDEIAFVARSKTGNILLEHGEIKSDKAIPDSHIVTRDNGVKIWLPATSSSTMAQWASGRYVKQFSITDSPYFNTITVEKATKSIVDETHILKIELFSILALLMTTAIILAYYVSRWLTIPANDLDEASRLLMSNITSGKTIPLPKSNIYEFHSLSNSLSSMASSLSNHYKELNYKNEYLQDVVGKNTDLLKRLSMVASRTTNGVVITDIKGNIEWANDAFINLTGYSLEFLIGKSPGGILQGIATDQKTVKYISEKIKLLQGFSEDLINYKKDGAPFWVHIDCDPIVEDGKTIGFIAIQSDITQKKNVEQSLVKRTTQLNAVLDAATEISIITTDANGLITMFNAGAEKMLGYNADEMINKQTPAIIHLPSEITLRGFELSKKLRKNIEGFRVFVTIPELEGSETREWTYVKKDGSHIIVQLSITFMQSHTGEIIGYLGVAQDITDRKKIEKLKNELVSTVSHELRTPLTSINGTLKLINGGVVGKVPEKVSELIDIASVNTERLNKLINDLLDMDKIANGKIIFRNKYQLLMPIIEQSMLSNQGYAEQFNVSLHIKKRVSGIKVKFDSDRLSQVLSNFISNAIKFSHSGHTVDIIVETKQQCVRVSVQDYGIGIDKMFYDHIFNKFSQEDTSEARSKGGTGLGLAISRELITRMDGKVGFDSEKNIGSTFWFELPTTV